MTALCHMAVAVGKNGGVEFDDRNVVAITGCIQLQCHYNSWYCSGQTWLVVLDDSTTMIVNGSILYCIPIIYGCEWGVGDNRVGQLVQQGHVHYLLCSKRRHEVPIHFQKDLYAFKSLAQDKKRVFLFGVSWFHLNATDKAIQDFHQNKGKNIPFLSIFHWFLLPNSARTPQPFKTTVNQSKNYFIHFIEFHLVVSKWCVVQIEPHVRIEMLSPSWHKKTS